MTLEGDGADETVLYGRTAPALTLVDAPAPQGPAPMTRSSTKGCARDPRPCSPVRQSLRPTPQVLQKFALHVQTGQPMPKELVEKVDKASKFNQSFGTVVSSRSPSWT